MKTYIIKTTRKIEVIDGYEEMVKNFFSYDSKKEFKVGYKNQFDFFDDEKNLMYRLEGVVHSFIIFNHKTGHISDDFKKFIDKQAKTIIKKSGELKIGITGRHPKNRFIEYLDLNEDWKEMIILYKTKSPRYIKDIEKYLIDKNWALIQNQIGGGGGRLSQTGNYYLYLIKK